MITALCRTVILYFLIMIGLRLMGKRQIGELEPSELVLTMMISDLATVPMQDFGIPLLAGVIPILILLSLTLLMSQLSLLNLRFRALMCGTPAILIRNGKLQQAAMRKTATRWTSCWSSSGGRGASPWRRCSTPCWKLRTAVRTAMGQGQAAHGGGPGPDLEGGHSPHRSHQ